MLNEGFMHIDITEELTNFISPSQKRLNYQPSITDYKSTDDMKHNTNVQQSAKKFTFAFDCENHASPSKVTQRPVSIAVPISKSEKTINIEASASNEAPKRTSPRKIRLDLELFDNDEYNINHISISVVRKKSLTEVSTRKKKNNMSRMIIMTDT